MKVLVDTCVWSLSLRRREVAEEACVRELGKLIKEYRVQMIGPVRQEVLSGIRHEAQFRRLQHHLRAFADFPLESADYERAAEFSNRCRRKGIQGSNTDFLICSLAAGHQMPVFTLDDDFRRFAGCLPFELHSFP